MPDLHQTRLNFISILLPTFKVFRRETLSSSEARRTPDERRYTLPSTSADNAPRKDYWITPDLQPGSEQYECMPETNIHLTLWFLYRSLNTSLQERLGAARVIERRGIQPELRVRFNEHPEGHEVLVLQPYYMNRSQEFGVCFNFEFEKKSGIPFSRRVQQLSLSLTAHGRRNLDACADQWRKIENFLADVRTHLLQFPFIGSADPARLLQDWARVPASTLRPRVYQFAGGKEGDHPYTGIREFGPHAAPGGPTHLLFMFEERHRQLARDLVAAIRGSSTLGAPGYDGFETHFRSPLTIDASPLVLPNWGQQSIEEAAQQAKERLQRGTVVVGVGTSDATAYYTQKALFTRAGVPTQHCTADVIANKATLKWSVANIALQIFAKAGGIPWKMRPSADPALIVGISQAHQLETVNGRTRVQKFFAFSVLTDSSGTFHSIRTLAEREDHDDYLADLAQNLQQVLATNGEKYRRVAVHTTYSIRREEMKKIENAVRAAAGDQPREFSMLRINSETQFFGANESHNSLVPIESTLVHLGGKRFLLWFEGVEATDRTVRKVYPGPTFIEITRFHDRTASSDDDLLQELINLSGANWRGFNAKSVPISTYYCHLVARAVREFNARQLPIPTGEIKTPWFL